MKPFKNALRIQIYNTQKREGKQTTKYYKVKKERKTEYHNRTNKQQDWMPENLKIWIEWKKNTKNMIT